MTTKVATSKQVKSDIQYITDDEQNVVAVILPIDLWREISAERETAYLLQSKGMKDRLLEALEDTENDLRLEVVRERVTL